jgi:hypothetical protein
MSAVEKKLTIIEPKTLVDVLVIGDQMPADFYTNPAYDAQLDKAIEASSNLVYTLDDEGEKKARSDATSINKFATQIDKFIAATYKIQTEAVTTWRDGKKAKTKLLLVNRQRLIDQFAEKRAKKLDEILSLLTDELWACRNDLNVKEEFYGCADLSPMVKLTGTLTESGALTKKAKDFVKAIAADNLAQQNKIEARHLLLENRCLREGINPPLTKVHFGTVFYAGDALFNEKLEELIAAEANRKAEMEERICKQLEAENQRKIDEALAAQKKELEEKNRLEEFKVEQARLREQQEIVRQNKTDVVIAANNVDIELDKLRQQKADRKNPAVDPVTHKPISSIPGKRTVRFSVDFEVLVSERVSNSGVQDHFLSRLPEDMKKMVKGIEFKGE